MIGLLFTNILFFLHLSPLRWASIRSTSTVLVFFLLDPIAGQIIAEELVVFHSAGLFGLGLREESLRAIRSKPSALLNRHLTMVHQ